MAQRIGVLFGGASTEHKISCLSAYHIAKGLMDAGYEVALVGITLEGEWLPFNLPIVILQRDDWEEQTRASLSNSRPFSSFTETGFAPRRTLIQLFNGEVDAIWPAVHGINCEDGNLQGFLELAGFPYVGAGVLASALGMDKVSCKRRCEYAGIPVVPWEAVTREEILQAERDEADGGSELLDRLETKLGYPCFLKPANGGSSVGTHIVRSRGDFISQLKASSRYDRVVLAETFVDARELEVAVIGNEELVVAEVGEIVKPEDIEYYDYEAKYLSENGTSLAIPADITDEVSDTLRTYAAQVYQLIGCAGMARVDFFQDKVDGALYFNEINTLPGFTSISLYPVAIAKALGSTEAMMTRMVELALERDQLSTREEAMS